MNLEAIQIELEDEMVSKGALRYTKEVARGLSKVGPGKALLRKALKPMAEAVTAACNVPNMSRAKKGVKYIKEIDAYVLADITMRRALDCAAKQETLIKTCKAVAKAVEWHVKDAALHAASIAIWNKQQERLKKTQNPEFRRASIDGTVAGMKRWAAENAPDLRERLDDVKGPDWGIKDQITVGATLIDLFASSTNLITTANIRMSRKKSKAIVRFTEGTQEWLERQHEYHAMLRPMLLPMVVPPTNWGADGEGGYLDNSKAAVSFIKTKATSIEFDTYDLADAYEAVNLIQSTPWRVNLSVMRIMNQVWETGSEIGSVPPRRHEDGARMVPALTSRMQDMTPEQRKADPECRVVMNKRRDAHEFNAELKANVKNFGALMAVSNRFAQYPAFYHPHKLDWRQRAYPVSIFMSPQGDQFNKGLIEFADGQRMGDAENSGAWLAIHGANNYGIDKVSFEDRIAWVESHDDLICESAMDPLANKWWTKADGGAKAWPFLAFCMEWLAYRIAGDDHVTHLPVSLDGANSGLQHLSAMLRDPDGAEITCLTPGDSPRDVYQMIADSVEAVLQDECRTWKQGESSESPEWAAIWHGKVTRKVCKQPTMTYTYSATVAGMRDQIVAALRDLDDKARTEGRPSHLEFTSPLQDNTAAADYLAKIVHSTIKLRMSKAAEAMEFLQKCARVYSKTDLPLRWTTPLGVPVVQYYPTSTSEQRKVFINGQRHDLRINVDSPDSLNKRRASSGVSPNFTHSCDSTHALWTTLFANDEYGIQDFAMIHDSFGTHATMCDQLLVATKEMFVALYDEDRLAAFRQELVDRLAKVDPGLIDEVPPVPEYGTFEIHTVRESDYFFA